MDLRTVNAVDVSTLHQRSGTLVVPTRPMPWAYAAAGGRSRTHSSKETEGVLYYKIQQDVQHYHKLAEVLFNNNKRIVRDKIDPFET